MGSMSPSPSTRLAILDCDTPLDEAQAKYGTYSGMFEALLRQAGQEQHRPALSDALVIAKWQVDRDGARYPEMDEIDAILITGSSTPLERFDFGHGSD